MRRAVLALCCAPAATAALAGLPEGPGPGPLPAFWLGTSNDNLGDGVLDRDDYRTGTVDAGGCVGRWTAAADASVLTDRATAGGSPGRTDQLTGSLGYVLAADDGRRRASWRLIAGAGARSLGDFGGERVQDALHQRAGYRPVDLPYDHERAVDPLAFACGRIAMGWPTPAGASFVAPDAEWGLSLGGAALATAGGEREGELELDVVYTGAEGSSWLGLRGHADSGTLPTPTAAAVADHERGWWLTAGATIEPAASPIGVWLATGIDPWTRAAVGSVGLDWRSAPPRGGSFEVEQDIGYYSGAVVGFQYRWQPQPLAELGPQWLRDWLRNEVLLDYRFGASPNYEWRDVKVLSDQAMLGHSPTLTPPPLFGLIRLMPYAYGAIGVRVERVAAWGPSPRFAEQGATRGVAATGFGLRVAPRVGEDLPSFALLDRLRLGIGYDRWFPWRTAPIGKGGDRDRYQQVNWGVGGYVGVMMAW